MFAETASVNRARSRRHALRIAPEDATGMEPVKREKNSAPARTARIPATTTASVIPRRTDYSARVTADRCAATVSVTARTPRKPTARWTACDPAVQAPPPAPRAETVRATRGNRCPPALQTARVPATTTASANVGRSTRTARGIAQTLAIVTTFVNLQPKTLSIAPRTVWRPAETEHASVQEERGRQIVRSIA